MSEPTTTRFGEGLPLEMKFVLLEEVKNDLLQQVSKQNHQLDTLSDQLGSLLTTVNTMHENLSSIKSIYKKELFDVEEEEFLLEPCSTPPQSLRRIKDEKLERKWRIIECEEDQLIKMKKDFANKNDEEMNKYEHVIKKVMIENSNQVFFQTPCIQINGLLMTSEVDAQLIILVVRYCFAQLGIESCVDDIERIHSLGTIICDDNSLHSSHFEEQIVVQFKNWATMNAVYNAKKQRESKRERFSSESSKEDDEEHGVIDFETKEFEELEKEFGTNSSIVQIKDDLIPVSDKEIADKEDELDEFEKLEKELSSDIDFFVQREIGPKQQDVLNNNAIKSNNNGIEIVKNDVSVDPDSEIVEKVDKELENLLDVIDGDSRFRTSVDFDYMLEETDP